MVTNRFVLNSTSNGVDPTGFKSASDAATMFRKVSTLLAACAQGAHSANLSISNAPIAAQATVTTVNGTETAADTLTVAGVVITLETSGATGNQANIAAGTKGTSTGGASGAITATGLQMYVNINNDGPQLIYVDDGGTHTGAHIAAVIQAAIRALTPNNVGNATAYSAATCAFTSTHYLITSGAAGSNSTVVVTSSPSNDAAKPLKLGVFNGGTEAAGTATTMNNIANLINGAASSWAGICTALACGNVLTLTAVIPGTIGNGLALAVSSTGTVMTITNAWGASVAGSEGTIFTYNLGA